MFNDGIVPEPDGSDSATESIHLQYPVIGKGEREPTPQEIEMRAEWWESGQKWSEDFYKEGILNGTVKKWHENGQIMVEGTVLNGIDEGVWKNWWENGTQSYEGIYENGDLLILIGRWNEDGTEKKDAFWWE